MPPVNVSKAEAVSGVVFRKYIALACVSVSPVVGVVKNPLLKFIPVNE
jgi:hypothetical protein